MMIVGGECVRAFPSEPYILTNTINALPVEKTDCVTLITSVSESQFSPEKQQQQQEVYDSRLKELETDYQAINQKIEQLNDDPEYSLSVAQAGLESMIEWVYYEYYHGDESFEQLSAESQLETLQQHEQVQEWQQLINDIQEMMNQLIAQRNEIELEYQQILYDLEALTTSLESQTVHSEQLNQCLLYPYSVPLLPVEHVFLNFEAIPLEEMLVQLDQVVQKLVPYTYRKLTYSMIWQAFSQRLDQEGLSQALYGKENVRLDEQSLNQYSYEKELNQMDVEILSNFAQRQFLQTEDETAYYESYVKVLDLKEAQLQYFMSLNLPTWEWLKQQVAHYLNAIQAEDDASIEKVKQFHEKYQVKLVQYIDGIGWQPVDEIVSGYYVPFQQRVLNQYDVESQERSLSQTNLSKIETSVNKDTTSSSQSDQLSFLKNKLKETQQTPASTGSLVKRNTDSETASMNTLAKTNNNDKKKSVLPTTGEQRIVFYVALILVIIGIILVGYDRYQRKKNSARLKELDLD